MEMGGVLASRCKEGCKQPKRWVRLTPLPRVLDCMEILISYGRTQSQSDLLYMSSLQSYGPQRRSKDTTDRRPLDIIQ